MTCDGAALYNTLWQQARIELPGVLDPALELGFQAALREFFRESLTWREELKIRALNGRQSYPLNNYLRHGVVQWVQSASLDGSPLTALTDTSRCASQDPAVPNRYSIENVSKLILWPEPKFDDGKAHDLCAHVALIPPPGTITTAGCGALPGDLLQTYFDAILDGVLGRMMIQQAKPYTNYQLGAAHLRQFKYGITKGRDNASRGNSASPAPWSYPRFGV